MARAKHQGSLSEALDGFEAHLKQAGRSDQVITQHMQIARRFVAFVGNEPMGQITEGLVREFLKDLAGASRQYQHRAGMIVGNFLRYAMVRLPVPAGEGLGPQPPATSTPIRDAKEAMLRDRWTLDRVLREKEAADDLIALLGRKLINHYLFFQSRLSGEAENLDELIRLADECRDLIQTNLAKFIKLSAATGKNLHPVIDERVMR